MKYRIIALALALASPLAANALVIDADLYEPCPPITNNPDGRLLACGLDTSTSVINGIIDDIVGDPSLYLYKADDEELDTISGPYAGSYTTTFNPNNDAEDALVELVAGASPMTASHVLVKGGSSTPAWWLFDISDWNGIEDLELRDFWDAAGAAGRGAISHITIYGDIKDVPEPTTLSLLGACLIGVALTRRRKLKA